MVKPIICFLSLLQFVSFFFNFLEREKIKSKKTKDEPNLYAELNNRHLAIAGLKVLCSSEDSDKRVADKLSCNEKILLSMEYVSTFGRWNTEWPS